MFSLKVKLASKEKVLKKLGKSFTDLEECVDLLKEWLKTQRHLPEIASNGMIEFVLVNNKFSIEKSKQKLDMYYSIRSMISEIYNEVNPKLPRVMACLNSQYILPMPTLVDDMYRLIILRVKSNDEGFSPNGAIANIVNLYEIRTQEDLMLSDIILFDLEHLKLSHIYKTTPMHAKISRSILEKVYSNRVKEVHVLNYPPFADILLKLAKTVLKPKLFNRIIFHESTKSLTRHIPLDVLPKDYGGNEKSLDQLEKLWKIKLLEYEDRFDKLDYLRVDESLRRTPMKDIEKFGVPGTFRKLNVD